tara:strand:- start:21886 stop:22365 length:480 start_codon:yes stop_codon:yes gene_type:complete
MSDIEERLRILEDIQEIKNLKHTYLNACDEKDVQSMLSTFVKGQCEIDYGAVGVFDNREDLGDVFTNVACHSYMVEAHHAHNPIINIIDPNNAKGIWKLTYSLINTDDQFLTTLNGKYDDEYIKINDSWLICKTTFTATSTLQSKIEDDMLKVIFAGSA